MASKLGTKAAAALPAAAHRGGLARGPQGRSCVALGPAASRTKGLRAVNNSVTPMAKYETSFTNNKLFDSMNGCCAWFLEGMWGVALDPDDFVLVRRGVVLSGSYLELDVGSQLGEFSWFYVFPFVRFALLNLIIHV